ncbi:two-component sensor histidine kinase [Streptomyces ipomoeae]|uniref:histidine kinase n=2 Tax=Streptomyces ipomoeae TaxID=103232 RepID=L1KRQ9_9ACTN|nr:histidine kinase [Streptomyces ipomoeae]EKX63068.1 ATPase/histidine kinase/DNA gyrase B/HSP90 domain protein [Streptomyces ipomoeae 91-03]MDX2693793.1 histidine kinase [Streptomyces ipomoeae]MDX2828450.1 histidine kinase [Streptomyces ipomoeae]MDX2839214.1 histidine kinase [Streptomyces ipomoeae]MDX2874271.1 histidine kinase [Streptomyces ipomoeae]
MSAGEPGDRARLGDWVIAVGVAATLLVTGLSGQRSAAALDPLGYALLTVGGLALAARRRAPVAVLAVTGLCAVGYQAVGFDVPAVAYLFAVYAAVRAGHRTATVAASVAMLGMLPLAALTSGSHDTGEAFAQARGALELAWLIAAGAAGEALRQAERRADEAERTREETARRRADEERLHIARELHDSLTHQISVIKVQAEVAVHVARKRGEQVPEALLAIQEAGREASRELRATLEALRDDDTAPPRGLDHVPELVERASKAGLEATLTIEGQRHDVPAAVGRTVYRIVQEALTNIARHADAGTASVRIDCRPDALALRIDDDGKATPAAAPTPGVGLLGMRERVTALGGRLLAQPRGEGGFTVQAELPLDRTA